MALVSAWMMMTGGTASAQSTDDWFPPDQPGLTLARDTSPGAPGTYKISIQGVAGRVYLMQKSTDPGNPSSWSWMDTQKLGHGQMLEWWFTPVSTNTRLFYRVKMSVSTGYTDDTAADPDGDGLTTTAEMALGTDPFNSDTDGDGMPDGWENTYGLDALSAADGGTADTDGDGIPNLTEFFLGSIPKGSNSLDSDKDGLTDAQEYAAGGNPAKFDLPGFTILSEWRMVKITDSLSRNAANTVTHAGSAVSTGTFLAAPGKTWNRTFPDTAAGTPDNFPWAMSTAATAWSMGSPGVTLSSTPETVHDMSQPLSAFYLEEMHGGGGYINVNPSNPKSEESKSIQRTGTLMERVIRIKASRNMPPAVTWNIPWTRTRITRPNTAADWSSANTTTTSGTFVMSPGQQYSGSVVTLNAASLSGSVCQRPGRVRNITDTDWIETGHTISQATEWLTIGRLTALPNSSATSPTGDADGDGLTNAFETQLGTDPGTANSDGGGHRDGDQLNSGVLPPAASLVISTRRSHYAYANVPPASQNQRLHVETSIPAASRDSTPASALQLDQPFQDALAAAAPFPAAPPANSGVPLNSPDGPASLANAWCQMQYGDGPDSSVVSAYGTQQKIWLTLPEAPAAAVTYRFLKIREVSPLTGAKKTTVTPVDLTITPPSAISNAVELSAKRLPNGANPGATTVVERLARIRTVHALGDRADQEMGAIPQWMPSDGIGKGPATPGGPYGIISLGFSGTGSSSTATLSVFGQSWSLTETAPQLWKNSNGTVSARLTAPRTANAGIQETLKVSITAPAVSVTDATYALQETGIATNTFAALPPGLALTLPALSSTAVDTVTFDQIYSGLYQSVSLVETGPAIRIFTGYGRTVQLMNNPAAGGSLQVRLALGEAAAQAPVYQLNLRDGAWRAWSPDLKTNTTAESVPAGKTWHFEIQNGYVSGVTSVPVEFVEEYREDPATAWSSETLGTGTLTFHSATGSYRTSKPVVLLEPGASMEAIPAAEKPNYTFITAKGRDASIKGKRVRKRYSIRFTDSTLVPQNTLIAAAPKKPFAMIMRSLKAAEETGQYLDEKANIKPTLEALGYDVRIDLNTKADDITGADGKYLHWKEIVYLMAHGGLVKQYSLLLPVTPDLDPDADFKAMVFNDDTAFQLGPVWVGGERNINPFLTMMAGCTTALTNRNRASVPGDDGFLPGSEDFAQSFRGTYVGYAWQERPGVVHKAMTQFIKELKAGRTFREAFIEYKANNRTEPYVNFLKMYLLSDLSFVPNSNLVDAIPPTNSQ